MIKESDVLEFIAVADKDTVDRITDIVWLRRSRLAKDAKMELSVGDTVRFNAGRNRGLLTGELVKKNPKKAKVRVDETWRTVEWSVPYTLLNKV